MLLILEAILIFFLRLAFFLGMLWSIASFVEAVLERKFSWLAVVGAIVVFIITVLGILTVYAELVG